MPVSRCSRCRRGHAGYLDGEKTLSDLALEEIHTEILKYEANEDRIRDYMANISAGFVTPETYPDARACPECGQGWREFDNHRRDLEQLSEDQARAALGANNRWLVALRQQEAILTGTRFAQV
jgi:hypothetical protein